MSDLWIHYKPKAVLNGAGVSPIWVGFHDASFDLFDVGGTTSAELELLVEDGEFSGLLDLFRAPGSTFSSGVAGNSPFAQTAYTGPSLSSVLHVDGLNAPLMSFAAQVLPSNDAFIGTDDPVRLFDDSGVFLGTRTFTLLGADVLDAGTETNTEVDANFLDQIAPGMGIAEGGTIQPHPGYIGSFGNPSGTGNILGGTNTNGIAIDPVRADCTQPGFVIGELRISEFVRLFPPSDVSVYRGTDADDLFGLPIAGATAFGGAGYDVIQGHGGNNRIFGGEGDDTLAGGDGIDRLSGGPGDDYLFWGEYLDGGAGHDWLVSGRVTTDALIRGGSGNDTVIAGSTADDIFGGSGDDFVRGAISRATGNYRAYGEEGNDFLEGSTGVNRLIGGAGNDTLLGGLERDRLEGGAGNDLIFGDAGNDTLIGGRGNDRMFGGDGADVFVIGATDDKDRIGLFDPILDRLDLRDAGVATYNDFLAIARDAGTNLRIDIATDHLVTLTKLSLADLDEDNFIF